MHAHRYEVVSTCIHGRGSRLTQIWWLQEMPHWGKLTDSLANQSARLIAWLWQVQKGQ